MQDMASNNEKDDSHAAGLSSQAAHLDPVQTLPRVQSNYSLCGEEFVTVSHWMEEIQNNNDHDNNVIPSSLDGYGGPVLVSTPCSSTQYVFMSSPPLLQSESSSSWTLEEETEEIDHPSTTRLSQGYPRRSIPHYFPPFYSHHASTLPFPSHSLSLYSGPYYSHVPMPRDDTSHFPFMARSRNSVEEAPMWSRPGSVRPELNDMDLARLQQPILNETSGDAHNDEPWMSHLRNQRN
jgi:hypothetical protein